LNRGASLMVQIQYRDGMTSLRMALSRRALAWVLGGRDKGALPAHVVLPGDEVSGEMLVAGLHEGQFLQPLFEVFLKDRLPDFSGKLALDVGANIGNHSLFFSRYFKSVISVEPNPRTLHILRANVGVSGANIRVLPMGFADRDASLEFFSNTHGNLGASGFAFAGGPTDQTSGARIECPVRRGDDVIDELALQDRIGLVKLDVEGAELAAIKGLSETLRVQQPVILFECLQAEGEGGGKETFAYLRGLGYQRFYAVESSVSGAKPGFLNWLKRLCKGEIVGLRELALPEPGQAYLMILALPAGQLLAT
jgi:FkbM family methyltransferase